MDIKRSTFGKYIREGRARQKVSLRMLSETSGVSLSQLSKIENDEAVPKYETICKIANALSLDEGDALFRAGYVPSNNSLIHLADNSSVPLERSFHIIRLYSFLADNISTLRNEKSFRDIKDDLQYLNDNFSFSSNGEAKIITSIELAISQIEACADLLANLKSEMENTTE
jgi:transcriptional regulator with XRE-family HTH domain